MRLLSDRFGLTSGLIILALLTGCLISGTFVVTAFFTEQDFTTQGEVYFFVVDLTQESEWEDHQDDIESVDLIGFELWITNHDSVAAKFRAYVDELGQPVYNTEAELISNAVPKVFGDLTINPGANTVTYAESLALLTNLEALKTLVESGTFQYYGVATTGNVAGYTIDSARVIVTLSAGNT